MDILTYRFKESTLAQEFVNDCFRRGLRCERVGASVTVDVTRFRDTSARSDFIRDHSGRGVLANVQHNVEQPMGLHTVLQNQAVILATLQALVQSASSPDLMRGQKAGDIIAQLEGRLASTERLTMVLP